MSEVELPTAEQVERWRAALSAGHHQYLLGRHIPASITEEYEVGFDGNRLTIPIRDSRGTVVNMRRLKPGAQAKVLNLTGHGRPTRLYPATELDPTEWVIYAGGEWDALSARAEGVQAVCGTNGEGSVPGPDELRRLAGFRVAVILDNDSAGRKAAIKVAAAVAAAGAAEVRVVTLPHEGMDLNDWIVQGGSYYGMQSLIAHARVARARVTLGALTGRALERVAGGSSRNDTGFWLACQSRDAGYTEAEAWSSALLPFQSSVADAKSEPYGEAEARVSLDSAYSQAPRAALTVSRSGTSTYELSELGNAERLVAQHGADFRYIPPLSSWFIWDERRWSSDTHAEIMRNAKASARAIRDEVGGIDEKADSKVLGWALASSSRARLESTIKLAQSEPGVSMMPSEFDAEPMRLNVRNGTLDLVTGTLHAHRREDYNQLLVDLDYLPNADAPKFLAFLERIQPDPEVRAFLQRAVGYSLTGRTDEQKLILGHGTGSNGKTTLIEIMHDLLGGYATFLPAEALVQSRGDRIPNDIARLKGARFVSVMEFDDSAPLNERLVKQLTGGDTISARFMRGEFFDFRPQCTIWVSTNHHPIIRGADDGIWRRFLLVSFPVKIPAHEIDRTLRQTIRDTELPGVLRWAVEGAIEWGRVGLNPPAAVLAATETYRRDSDVLGSFLEELCIVNTGQSVAKSLLYDAYKTWCSEAGLRPATKISFGRMLKERPDLALEEERIGKLKTHTWFGLGLASESPHRVRLSVVGGSTDPDEEAVKEPPRRVVRR